MNKKLGCSFCISVLMLSLWSASVLADPAEELAQGEIAFNREDLTKAMELFTLAAKQGYAPAQVRLGEILDASEYDKEAVDWYRKAAEQGDAAGEYSVGHMYITGEGVEKNAEKALYWLRRAAEKDYLIAVRSLAQAYRRGGMGLAIDLEQAKLLEDRANYLDAVAKKAAAKKAAEKAAAAEAAK